MIRKEENGSVSFSFAAEEWKKIKYGLCAAGAVAVLAAGAGIYSAASMASLRSENELYRNQLKMAEEKMEGLEEKTQAVEKLSNELRDMLKGNAASPAPMSESGDGGQGGQGGGSTVPPIPIRQAAETQRKPLLRQRRWTPPAIFSGKCAGSMKDWTPSSK